MLGDTISGPQLRKLHASFRGVDRDVRLERISLIVSRRVGSSLDLTAGEASLVIDRLERDNEQVAW